MNEFEQIIGGFSVSLQPINLLYTFVGVLLGTAIGVLPGIGPSAAIALLIPISYSLNPTSALIMMAGVYYGAQYGGAVTSILINTPGESSSVMTALEGHKMARKGRAGAALAVSAWGSFVGGTVGVIGLTFLAIPLTKFALSFGPSEYFMVMVVALSAVFTLAGKSPAKGMMATMLGLLIATIGTDLQSGQVRFSMGIPSLQDGIDFVIVVVGLFAVGEVLVALEDYLRRQSSIVKLTGKLMMSAEEWRRSILPIVRGSVIGFVVGVLPGAGATIASLLSYSVEKNCARKPEEFGHGAIEGVAGPEAANNAASAGSMVPLLTLGVPGSGSTAVLLGAFVMFGIQPGPMLFATRPDVVWGLVNSMYVGNIMLLILNLPLIALFVRLLYVPTSILLPVVMVFSIVGIYALNNSVEDLRLCLMFGVLGYIFRKVDIPLAPLVLALVLGRSMEQSFRQAMTISDGDLSIFIRSPIGMGLAAIGCLVLAVTIKRSLTNRPRMATTEV